MERARCSPPPLRSSPPDPGGSQSSTSRISTTATAARRGPALKEAGAAGSAVTREEDLLVGYGGEEFALLLAGCQAVRGREIVERLRRSMPVWLCAQETPIKASSWKDA